MDVKDRGVLRRGFNVRVKRAGLLSIAIGREAGIIRGTGGALATLVS